MLAQKITAMAAILFLCLSMSGCDSEQESAGKVPKTQSAFTSVSVGQAVELMRARKDLLVVDVRSPKELKEGKIPGSILVPFWNILKGNYNLPKDRPLLLVCAVGGRSYGVGKYLAGSGYKEIYNMSGGMNAWKRARYPVVY